MSVRDNGRIIDYNRKDRLLHRMIMTKHIIPNLLVLLFSVVFPNVMLANEQDTTMLIFTETEPGVEGAYQTRMLITPDYLRMDDGGKDNDYVLMNRKTRTIYSVSHEDERVVVINNEKPEVPQPDPFRHKTEEADAGGVPDIDGKRVRLYRFFTNGSMCFEVYAVQGFLDDAVKALSSFSEILAGQHARTVASIPAEFQSSCDLANNVFEPSRYLSKGFPVRQRDDIGRTRTLQEFKNNIKKPIELFVIPDKYEKFYPGLTRI